MTGAPVPTDADAIVPFEDTAGGLADSLGSIRVTRAPRARGAHIRRRAEDLAAGDIALPAGRPLGPLQISSLIASGVTSVAVARRPRVAVVSTGAELTAPGVVPGASEIPDSNSTLLERLCAQAGAEVVVRAHVGDDPAELLERLEHTAADVVITSGGVSAGAYEPVKLALDKRIRFDRVAMQPGKPQAFGVLEDGALFFGLPGNPVSVAVSFEMFVRPALLALQGRAQIDRPRGRFPATEGWRTPVGRTQVIPVAWDGAGVRPATAGVPDPTSPAASGSPTPTRSSTPRRRSSRRATSWMSCCSHEHFHPPRCLRPCPHGRRHAETADGPRRHGARIRARSRLDDRGAARRIRAQGGRARRGARRGDPGREAHARAPAARARDRRARGERRSARRRRRRLHRGDVPDRRPHGVEMEAITAVTVAALAVLDMVKGIDRTALIESARIVKKTGGRSGDWVRDGEGF